jgi:hypothetical protein
MSARTARWFNPSEGEEILWEEHPSRVMNLPYLAVGILIAIISTIAAGYIVHRGWPLEYAGVMLFIAIIGVGFSYVRRWKLNKIFYVITNKRVIIKTGIIGKNVSSKSHDDIVRVDVTVTPFEAIVSRLTKSDIGDIVLRSADDTAEQFRVEQVPDVGSAESYLEQLSGSGPNPAAKYGSPDPNNLESKSEPRDKRQTREHTAHDAQPLDTSSSQTEPPGSEQTANESTVNPDPADDEFDPFEPSDKA